MNGSIIFDFDSTLIRIESLERVVGDLTPQQRADIESITRAAMAGEVDFLSSLQKRLAIVQPVVEHLHTFTADPHIWLSKDAVSVIHTLHTQGHEVWIVSGGLDKVIAPFAYALGISHDRVHCVKTRWENNTFHGIDADDPFARSKVEGIATLSPAPQRPMIMVGDGMTDAAVWQQGPADHFIAYTEHVARPAVTSLTPYHAPSMQACLTLVNQLLHT